MPPAHTESEKTVFITKLKVLVKRSLSLVPFEMASLVESVCKI